MWKLNNTFLNSKQSKEIKREIKNSLEINENEKTSHQEV